MNYSSPMDPLEAALTSLKLQKTPNVRGTSRKFGIVESTLRRRFRGKTVSFQQARYKSHNRLSHAQKKTLIIQINRLTDRGLPPTTKMMKNFAEEIVQGPVGKNWVGALVKRYRTELKSIYFRNMNSDRMKSEYAPVFKHFYDLVSENFKCLNVKCLHCLQLIHYTEKYHFTPDVIWNWDEKGFLIEQASITQRIMSLEAYRLGRITHASQNGSREFISSLACISAHEVALPPVLIYKGEHLQDSWLEDLNEGEKEFFTSSSKG